MLNLTHSAVVLAVLTLLPAVAYGAVPATVAVQGTLTSATGGPAADGAYLATFALFATETGGSAVWTEGPVNLDAKNGLFAYQLGAKKPFAAASLNMASAWMEVTVGADPPLPRKPVGSVLFAQRAAVADGLECSACVQAGQLDAAVLAPFAKAADLGAYAKSSDLGAFAKTADLGDYVKAAALAKVAGSGEFSDLKNPPKLADVATTGAYGDLTTKPVLAKLGASCGTGLVLNGLKSDGSLDCGPLALPPDGIDEISNGLIWNQFVDSQPGTPDVGIPDGKGAGQSDSLVFPDIGTAQAIWVDVDLTNSDISAIKIELYAPNTANPYLLYDGGKAGATLKTSFNKDTPLVTGNLGKDWVGKNITGTWSITVKDPLDNVVPANDGKFNWAISIQTLSSKKIRIAGDTYAEGGVKIGTTKATCNATNLGMLRSDASGALEACTLQRDQKDVASYAWAAAKPRPVIWSGGCPSHSQGSGWATYCLDGVDINEATGYLTADKAGPVTFKISGYYRFNFYAIQHGCGQQDFQFLLNGALFAYKHDLAPSASNQWHHAQLDNIWPVKVGDQFVLQAYHSGCGDPYRWHLWDKNGAHSRLQIEYVGPLK